MRQQRSQREAQKWLDKWNWKSTPGMRLLTDKELQDLMFNAYVAGFDEANRIAAVNKAHSFKP